MLQAVIATTKRAAWCNSPRGLGAADLAMHVVLPELDGRVLAGAVAFKDPLPPHEGLAFTALVNQPEPDRIAMVAERVAALVRLRTTPRDERRIAILMPDYPGAPGRTGYAVGLDVPASVVALLADLATAGYAVGGAPQTSRALLDALATGSAEAALSLEAYAELLSARAGIGARAASRAPGASRRTIPMCARALPLPRTCASATSWWRCRPIADRSATGAPTITMPPCRRAMRWSPSGSGCSMSPRSMPSCIWARMARSNGCPARRWR